MAAKSFRGSLGRERRDIPLKLVDLKFEQKAEGGPFTFSGYGSVWGRLDTYGDTVMKGAFTTALQTRQPVMLFGHDQRQVPGKWTSAGEDEFGLKLEGELTPGHSLAADTAASLKHGSISGLSIGGYTDEAEYTEEGTRLVKVFDLYEVSIVAMPAENEARIDGQSVKSIVEECSTIRELEELMRDALGCSKSTAKAFIARCKRLSAEEPDGDLVTKGASELLDLMKSTSLPALNFGGSK